MVFSRNSEITLSSFFYFQFLWVRPHWDGEKMLLLPRGEKCVIANLKKCCQIWSRKSECHTFCHEIAPQKFSTWHSSVTFSLFFLISPVKSTNQPSTRLGIPSPTMAFLFDPDSFYPTLKSAKNWYKIAALKIQKSLPAIVLVLVCQIHCICYDLETNWMDFMVAVVLRISSSSKRQGFQVPINIIIFSSLQRWCIS